MEAVKNMLKSLMRNVGYDVYRIDRHRVVRIAAGPDYLSLLEDYATKLLKFGLTKAHYACGPLLYGNGWINIDHQEACFDSTESYIRADLTTKHPFPSNHFSFSFAEDFLEHLTQEESLIFLCEAFRCLKSGGVLRLSFPGLKGVLQRHYLRSDYEGAAQGREEAFTLWDHKHFYCEESLALVARHIGFSDVTFVKYGESMHEELRKLDSRADQQDLNIYAELTK